MRTVSTYYAFDDTPFDTLEECLAYEDKFEDTLCDVERCYNFFDENMNMIVCASDTLEDISEWLEKGYDESVYISIVDIPSKQTTQDIEYYYGYYLPTEPGLYKYNNGSEKWERV